MSYIIFFFFQAKDGIRDRVRSRGLGDVYKRQDHWRGRRRRRSDADTRLSIEAVRRAKERAVTPPSVSYTHLTLPTSDLV